MQLRVEEGRKGCWPTIRSGDRYWRRNCQSKKRKRDSQLLTTGVALVSCSNLLSPASSSISSPFSPASTWSLGSIFSRSCTQCNSRDEWLAVWAEGLARSLEIAKYSLKGNFRGVINNNNSPVNCYSQRETGILDAIGVVDDLIRFGKERSIVCETLIDIGLVQEIDWVNSWLCL